jgi:hypothetical protein
VNQRIKALAEQAGFQYIKDEGIGWAGNHNASLPKFAELIVKECIEISQVGSITESKLKKHFGLEE